MIAAVGLNLPILYIMVYELKTFLRIVGNQFNSFTTYLKNILNFFLNGTKPSFFRYKTGFTDSKCFAA